MRRSSSSAHQGHWVPLVDETTGRAYCSHVQTGYAKRPSRRFSSWLWSGLYSLGKLLTWPAEKTVETYLYIFNRSIKPGRYEQWSTIGAEKLHRALLLVQMVLLGTIAVLLFPFGVLLRFLAVSLGTYNFLFVRPNNTATDPTSFPAGSRVHVTLRTQNLGFLPHLSSANNLANPVKRVKYLLQELQLGRDDVLCFQECFDLGATKAIIRALNQPAGDRARQSVSERHESAQNMLRPGQPSDEDDIEGGGGHVLRKDKPIYPWVVADCDPRSYRLNSGQVIVSRYPLADPEFVRYTNRLGDDKMAGKGVLGCTVILGTTEEGRRLKLTVFTTHLQAGSAPPKDTIHLQQIRTAAKFVQYYNHKHIDESQDVWVGAVLMGDFNIAPINGDPEWWGNGKLTWDREWVPMNQIFHAHHMKNLFYEDTEDGEVRTHNRDLILHFQDVFADWLQALVEEIKAKREHDRDDEADAKDEAGTRMRIDAIGLTNQITAWLGRREESRAEREHHKLSSKPQQHQRKQSGEKNTKKKQKAKRTDVLVQISDAEVMDDDHSNGNDDADGTDDDEDDDNAKEEAAELKEMLTRELVRQARVVTGWRRTDQWFAEERPTASGHDDSDDDRGTEDAERMSMMVDLLRQLRAIPSDPVVDMFAHERRRQPQRAAAQQAEERGKWGRPKLRCDPRVEYVIPGTSVDKDNYEGKFPDEVDYNDLDHVWALAQLRGADHRLEQVRTRLVEYYPYFYTDHLGKRLEFQVTLRD